VADKRSEATIAGILLRQGDWLSLNGDAGTIVLGKRTVISQPPEELAEVERWRSTLRRLDRDPAY
jgi:pyruvate,orthophosphate dikinase